MVTYTRAEEFLKYYFTSPFSCALIAQGNANENYKVQVLDQTFFFRIYLPQKNFPRNEEQLKEEINLLLLFKDANFPVAAPIMNTNGEYFTRINGVTAALFEYINGTNCYGNLHQQQFSSIGKLMAKVHNFTLQNNINCTKTWSEGTFWKAAQKAFYENTKYFNPNEITEFQKTEESFKLLDSVKQYWIHGDFQFANLLFNQDNEVVGWLDFDGYRNGHFIEDLVRLFVSDLAYTAKPYYDLKKEHVVAFVNSYNEEKPLTLQDIKLIEIYLTLLSYWQIIRLSKNNDSRLNEFKECMRMLKESLVAK